MEDQTAVAIQNLRAMALAEVARLTKKHNAREGLTQTEYATFGRLQKILAAKSTSAKPAEPVTSPDPERLTISDAARFLLGDKEHRRTLQQWFGQGCPKNPDGTVSLRLLHEWRVKRAEGRGVNPEEHKWGALEQRFKALARRRRYLKEGELLISRDRAVQEFATMAATIASALERLPRELGPRLVGQSRASIETTLEQAIAEKLTWLADAPWTEVAGCDTRANERRSGRPSPSARAGGRRSARARRSHAPTGSRPTSS